MIDLKQDVERDSEFSDVGLGKPGPPERSRRTLRLLIYVHCVTAALTASDQIHHRLRFLATGDVHRHLSDLPFEEISVLSFLTVFLLPPLILAVAVKGRVSKREFLMATLATLALGGFQFLAILPAVQ